MKIILHNGKIRISADSFEEAMLIENDTIIKVGKNSEILKEKDENTELIDLEGKLCLPGFNDSHMHFLNVGYYFSQLNLGSTKSIAEAIEAGKKFIEEKQLQPMQWVQFYGWNDDKWEDKRFLTRDDLDKVSTSHPIIAARVCTHVVTANSKALELLNLENSTADGILYEYLAKLFETLPEPTVEEIKDMLITVGNAAASKGLTSVQSDDLASIPGNNYKNIIQAYAELAKEDKLPVRVYEQCRISDLSNYNEFKKSGFHAGMGKDIFRLGPLKTFCDGSLGARTAWLKEDYSDEPGNKGLKVYEDEKTLCELVSAAHSDEMSVAIHCIGDAAAEQAVSAIENAINLAPEKNVRHGIVHAQILNENLIDRMKSSNISAYIQPIFLEYDAKIAESRVGAARLENSYNYRKLYDAGIHIPFGTDSPVEDFNPMKNIYCALTGKDFDNQQKEVWHPEKLLNVDEAIDCYTLHPAYLSFDEKKKGKIAPGYLADVVVLEKDILKIPPEEIKDTEIYLTIMGGKIRYKKQ